MRNIFYNLVRLKPILACVRTRLTGGRELYLHAVTPIHRGIETPHHVEKDTLGDYSGAVSRLKTQQFKLITNYNELQW